MKATRTSTGLEPGGAAQTGGAARRPRTGRRGLAAAALATLLVLGLADTALATTADFTATPSAQRAGAAVSFEATATGTPGADDAPAAPIASLVWDFDDGSPLEGGGTAASTSHAFAAPGTYHVRLTATDADGVAAAAEHPVTVVGPPSAAFTWTPPVPTVGQSVAFDGSSSADPLGVGAYAWDFGDGGTATGPTPTHAFATTGDKTVTLTTSSSFDLLGTKTTRVVHVDPRPNVPPSAVLTFALVGAERGQDAHTPAIGQDVSFDAQRSGDPDGRIVSYEWDIGSGFTAPRASGTLTASFAKAGLRVVRVRVSDDRGATAVDEVDFRVDSPPKAAFASSPAAPNPGQSVTFTSKATDPDGDTDLKSLAWDLDDDGDYDDGSKEQVQASFTKLGDHTVGLKVTDKAGVSATTFSTVTVKGQPVSPTSSAAQGTPGLPAPVVVRTSSGDAAGSTSSPPPASSRVLGVSVSGRGALKRLVGVRVQIAGSVSAGRTRIRRLRVSAPTRSTVVARCQGAGCPKRSASVVVRSSGRVSLTTMQRSLRAGARIVIRIAKRGYVTREVVFSMRRTRAPSRREGCRPPGSKRAGACSVAAS